MALDKTTGDISSSSRNTARWPLQHVDLPDITDHDKNEVFC